MRGFTELDSESANEARLENMSDAPEQHIASYLSARFDEFYNAFREIPERARVAFEHRDHRESLRLSSVRLRLYSNSIRVERDAILEHHPWLQDREHRWESVDRKYRLMVSGSYHEDLAVSYLNSVRRKIFASEWLVEDYSSYQARKLPEEEFDQCYYHELLAGRFSEDMVRRVMGVERFHTPFQALERDVAKVYDRLRRNLRLDQGYAEYPRSVQFFRAGFYRNRGAYLVGRFNFEGDRHRPFIIALLNSETGIYVDAVITSSTYAHNMFSSTLANFHVTNDYYHEQSQFLKSIMPMRPLGLHYSTIGYNHLGKVAVMNEMESEITEHDELLCGSPGADGTVAIGFTAPSSAYHLKVIRNSPTDSYKWGEFEGVDSVLAKYTRVHEINRSDSMLDSIIYYRLRLPKRWFEGELLQELLESASHCITAEGDSLLFRYLIVQRKLTPLPVYLESATEKQAYTIMANLGYCIKNNAAANIFNKDLDARNYGVTGYSKVYLYDYDAIEDLGDVKVRTNLDRFDGEEDIPDWYFEDGFVFLPEELTAGLCLSDRELRKVFEQNHPELLTTAYWEEMQAEHAGGQVPRVSVYPESERITD